MAGFFGGGGGGGFFGQAADTLSGHPGGYLGQLIKNPQGNGTGSKPIGNSSGTPYNPLEGAFGPSSNIPALPTDPYGGMPTIPDYNSIADSNGVLKAPYSVAPTSLNYTQNAIDQLSDYAHTTGPSPWLNLQNQSIANDQKNYLDQMAKTSQGNLQSSWDALAAQGGLDSGAMERMAAKNNLNTLNANQGIFDQGFQARNAAALQDEGQKFNILQNLPQMQFSVDNAKLANDQFNAKNAIGAAQGQNDFNMNKYGIQMGTWGAGKTADAIGKGGNNKFLGIF